MSSVLGDVGVVGMPLLLCVSAPATPAAAAAAAAGSRTGGTRWPLLLLAAAAALLPAPLMLLPPSLCMLARYGVSAACLLALSVCRLESGSWDLG
jgi:hypothetical protein